MAKELTPVQVMNSVRPTVFQNLVKALSAVYGEENTFIIGDSEVAVKVEYSPTGEPIYARYSPTIANYTERTTKSKTIKAFDAPKEAAKYRTKKEEDAKKAEESAKLKAEQIERTKKASAEKARKIAEAKASKEGITRAKKTP